MQLCGSLSVLGASLAAQSLKRLPPMQETRVQSLGQEGLLEKEMATHSSILAWRIPWTLLVRGVTKRWTRLSDFHFHLYHRPKGLPWWLSGENLPAVQEMQDIRVQSLGQEGPLEEGMAIHSCILAWRIPWTEKPGRLQSMGSQESDTT